MHVRVAMYGCLPCRYGQAYTRIALPYTATQARCYAPRWSNIQIALTGHSQSEQFWLHGPNCLQNNNPRFTPIQLLSNHLGGSNNKTTTRRDRQ